MAGTRPLMAILRGLITPGLTAGLTVSLASSLGLTPALTEGSSLGLRRGLVLVKVGRLVSDETLVPTVRTGLVSWLSA